MTSSEGLSNGGGEALILLVIEAEKAEGKTDLRFLKNVFVLEWE